MLQYTKAATNNLDVQNLDSAVSRVFNSLMPNFLLNDPTLIQNVVFVASVDTNVSHMLGRPYKGYIICGLDSAASIYTSSTVNNNKNLYAVLVSTANVTANIIFF